MAFQSQDERVERAASRLTRPAVLSVFVRVLALLGLAGAAWLLASSTAHAESGLAPAPGTTAAPASTSRGLAAPSGPAARNDVAARGAPQNEGTGKARTAPPTDRALVHEVDQTFRTVSGPVSSALTPVTRNLADVVHSAATDTGRTAPPTATPVAPGSAPVTGTSLPGGTPARSAARQPGQLESPLDSAIAPLGLGDAASPLTDLVLPLADIVQPVTRTVTPDTDVLGTVTGAAFPEFPRGTTPFLDSVPLGQTVGSPLTATPAPTPALDGTAPGTTVPAGVVVKLGPPAERSSSPVGAAPTAPTFPLPALGSSFPALGSFSGGAAGASSPHYDGGTGSVEAGGFVGRDSGSRVSPATADAGVPRERAEDPAVSPD